MIRLLFVDVPIDAPATGEAGVPLRCAETPRAVKAGRGP
jgi:hypothetical protein